jgi:hypothetical protein
MPIKKSWDVLSTKNHHPRDDRIEFQEEGHKYKIDGSVDGWISATSILSNLHSPFDAKKAANMVIKSVKYRQGTHPLTGKSIDEIISHWEDENKKGTALHARMERTMQTKYEINKSISTKRVTAVFKGTNIPLEKHRVSLCENTSEVFVWYPLKNTTSKCHLHIGFLWPDQTIRRNRVDDAELGNDEPVLEWNEAIIESLQIKDFWENHVPQANIVPFRSEWVIWDEIYKIAGTIDALIYNPTTNGFWIYDWKRVSKGLCVDIDALRYGYQLLDDEWLSEVASWTTKMNKPVNELNDTKYWKYSLQLNIYKSILERCYGLKIDGMMLVQIHPSLSEINYHRVVNLDEPIRKILEIRKQDISNT